VTVAEEHLSALLPIVVERGGSMTRALSIHVPAEGSYEVTLAVEGNPDLVVARRPVRVSGGVAPLHVPD
jgi:hypothetical protein